MVSIGYALSSEEHEARDLVRNAQRAEAAGFSFALISDHFHPWIERQGQSPFVWSVLGAIATATERLQVGTGVTCPTIRMHPAIVAQAAAMVATMMPGRFFLGVGTGENLNEHVHGDRWPAKPVRREILREAVDVIRELWQGSLTSRYGKFYTVEQAKLYSVPEAPPPVHVAASGPGSGTLAGEIGDGLCSTAPDREVVAAFEEAGGRRQAAHRDDAHVLGRVARTGARDRARVVAELRARRVARAGAEDPHRLRGCNFTGTSRGHSGVAAARSRPATVPG